MKAKYIQDLIRRYDKENLKTELKKSDKFLDEHGDFNSKEMASILVSFANREGGYLIIGVMDDGRFESEDPFLKFSKGGKSGIDKFKEYVENLCKDMISPPLLIDVEVVDIEDHQVGVITVPKKKDIPHAVIPKHEGSSIRTREYYIRTTHGKSLVSDRQLEWLFLNQSVSTKKSEFVINLIFDNDLQDLSQLVFSELFPAQPKVIEFMRQLLNTITLPEQDELKIDIVRELIPYSIIGSHTASFDKRKYIPKISDHSVLSQYKTEALDLLLRSKVYSWSLPSTLSMKIKSGKDFTLLKFGNKHVLGTVYIKLQEDFMGLPSELPGRNKADFRTLRFTIHYSVTTKFPEGDDFGLKVTHEFCESIEKLLREEWDYRYYIDHFNHEWLLYQMNDKLDKLINHIK